MKKYDVLVATLRSPKGLDGSLHALAEGDFMEVFFEGNEFFCNGSFLTLKSCNLSGWQDIILRFEEINSRDEARELTNKRLFSSIDDTRAQCILKEGEFFYFDLVHLDVYDEETLLGRVEDVEEIANIPYLVVNSLPPHPPKRFYIPYIDRYCVAVDLARGRINSRDTLGILERS